MWPATSGTERALGRLLLAACCAALPIAASEPEPRLVGLVEGGREIGTLDVLRDDEGHLLPLRPMLALLELESTDGGDELLIETPLGTVALARSDRVPIGGVDYVRERRFAELLYVDIEFDNSTYSVEVALPWGDAPPGPTPRVPDRDVPAAEIQAPRHGLSSLRTSILHTRQGDLGSTSGTLDVDGRLGGGLWEVHVQGVEHRAPVVREALWFTRHQRARYAFGRQRMQLHRELNGFDLIGAQFAWTDHPSHDTLLRDGSGSLMPRRIRPLDTFQGTATPGNLVQLRIDGRPVSVTQVGYDGRYAFRDVPLSSQRHSRVEMLVFEPGRPRIPIEIHEVSTLASDLMLPRRVSSHVAGAGSAAAYSDGFGDDTPRDAGGFYRYRHGVTNRWTVEGAAQHALGQTQAQVGFVTRPSRTWVLAAGLLAGEQALGYELDVEHRGRRWQMIGRATSSPAGLGMSANDRHDRYVDVVRQLTPRLRVGLHARDLFDGARGASFVLPTLSWTPGSGLYLDARPDLYGDYLVHGAWQVTQSSRLRVYSSDLSSVEWTQDLYSGALRMAVGTEFGDRLPATHSLTMTRRSRTSRGIELTSGILRSADRWGVLLGANTRFVPGVLLRAEYRSLPYRVVEGLDSPGRFVLSIITELGHAAGRWVPRTSGSGSSNVGGLAGRVRVAQHFREEWGSAARGSLEGIPILVNGEIRARTDSAGRFHIGNLSRGTHAVSVDAEGLPLELGWVRDRHLVAIERGATTRVDFETQPQLGIAGRLTDWTRQPLVGIVIELLDDAGRVVGTCTSDRFGLFRIDGITPGIYKLRAVHDDWPDREMASRLIEVDEFLFDQNLIVNAE
ncbi:MAG: carboxypeptidase regulatory-like domain-containing protein [bacterium]|nr:carboxypeptidase regulatory-like domain-containing protein [bacterium]